MTNEEMRESAERTGAVNMRVPIRAEAQMRALISEQVNKDGLISKIASYKTTVPQRGGRVAEVHHAETFNCDAILKGKPVTAWTDGCNNTPVPRNDPVYDIMVLDKGGEVALTVQSKVYRNAKETAKALRATKGGTVKYEPADSFLVSPDQLGDVKSHADLTSRTDSDPVVVKASSGVGAKATDKISVGGVESKPLPHRDAQQIGGGTPEGKATRERTQNEYKDRSTRQQMANAALSAVITTAVISATISTVDCLSRVQKGEMTDDEAVKEILVTTSVAAADSALKAAAAAGTVSIVKRKFPDFFNASSVLRSDLKVGAVAGATICAVDIVQCLVLVAVDRMTLAEMEERTGKNIFHTGPGVVGSTIGGALGAIGGPPGVFLGAMAGGMITSLATTIAIENHIDGPYRQALGATKQMVRTGLVMNDAIENMRRSQEFFEEYRRGLKASEAQFDHQMNTLRLKGDDLARAIDNL